MISCMEEFPNLGITRNRTGKATLLYVMARVRMLMFLVPNSYFVQSYATLNCGLSGHGKRIKTVNKV